MGECNKQFKVDITKSLKPYTELQMKNWESSNKIEICRNEKRLMEFIRNAQIEKMSNKKIYFGIIPDYLAERVMNEFCIDIKGYNCVLRADEVRKIMKSHGRVGKEQDRGQAVVTVFDFRYIPEIIGNPDVIEHGGIYFNKPVLKFTKGKRIVVAVVSRKHLDVYAQTMYIKKKSLATTPDDNNIFPHTSETLSGTASKDSIAKKQEKTTPKEKINS